jgi:osmotically-inducible protein OsmY
MIKLYGAMLALVVLAFGVVNAIEPAGTDASLQTKLDRAHRDDPSLSAAGVTATVIGGKATLNGAVPTEALRTRAERLAYAVKGVRSVDNRITVVPDN